MVAYRNKGVRQGERPGEDIRETDGLMQEVMNKIGFSNLGLQKERHSV